MLSLFLLTISRQCSGVHVPCILNLAILEKCEISFMFQLFYPYKQPLYSLNSKSWVCPRASLHTVMRSISVLTRNQTTVIQPTGILLNDNSITGR